MNDLTYTVISFAPDEIDRQFEAVKKRFNLYIDRKVTQPQGIITKNHAHITLKRAFSLREDVAEQEIIEALSKLDERQMIITASSLEVFHTQKHGEVVVALVDDNSELVSLHNRLESALAPCTKEDPDTEQHPFRPHLSFFYHVPESRLEEVSSYSREHLLPIRFSLRTLSLLRQVNGLKGEKVRVKDFPQI